MYRRQIRIPTLAALFILLFGLGGGIVLIETSNPLTSSADANINPSNIHITNVTDSQFSVSWFTNKPTTGYITYTDKSSPSVTDFDDRDEDGIPKSYITHHVTLRNLKESTIYYFRFVSGNKTFDNQGQFYSQNTGPKLSSSLSINPAYGVLLQANDKPAEGAIVYITIGKSLPMSTLVKSEGTWLIPLNNSRTQDLLGRPQIGNPEVIQITAYYNGNNSSFATTDTKNDSPVPTMNLGKSYDFRNFQSRKDLLMAQNSQNANVLGTSNVNQLKNGPNTKIDFIFPDKNNATSIDNKPLFRGLGIPGKEIIITVNSTPQTAKVTVEGDGTWSYIPVENLPPGEHSINISTTDSSGKIVSLTRSFIVLKSGESVLGESTPSASLTPQPFATITPFVTLQPTNSATTSTPVTGNIEPTYFFLGSGVLLFILGLKYLIIP